MLPLVVHTCQCNSPAVGRAVTAIRGERERLGLDPAIPICHPIVTAPDMDDGTTLKLTGARLVTYLQLPDMAQTYLNVNQWDPAPVQAIHEFPAFAAMDRPNADQSFRLDDLLEPAKLIPDDWLRETAAIGSVDECVATLQKFRDAGADEVAIYGSDPAENAALIDAWRAR